MDPGITIGGISAVASVAVGVYAARSSRKSTERAAAAEERAAKRVADNDARKVDLEVYDKTIAWYKEQLTYLKGLIDVINGQLERVNRLLAGEQDISNELRNEVRRLQAQIEDLERKVAERQTVPPDIAPIRAN